MPTVDRELLVQAVEIIRIWHGIRLEGLGEMRAWELYLKSPEMKEIREALEKDK